MTKKFLVGILLVGIVIGIVRGNSGDQWGFSGRVIESLRSGFSSFRNIFDASLVRALPEPEASLARGILIGRSQSFSQELQEAMRKTSTLHLVAVSGYNISIVAIAIMAALNFLTVSRKWSWIVAMAGIIFYTVFVGAPTSAVRAAIMGALLVIARHSGRVTHARNALALAAGMMVLQNPRVLRWDLGFQLSFLATIGIIWVSPRIARVLRFMKENILSDTLGAQVMVTPWIFYKFGTITLLGLGANILVIPIIPLTMFWSFLGGSVGMVSASMGQVVAGPAYIFLRYSLWIIGLFSKIPFANVCPRC